VRFTMATYQDKLTCSSMRPGVSRHTRISP
jgi:hypothetical protein